MEAFDLVVLVLLALIALVAFGILALLMRSRDTGELREQFDQVETRINAIVPKIDRVDTRIGDNITVIELRLETLQKESGSASRELRQEVLTAFDKLANAVVARVSELADAQSRRLDGFASQLTEHRTTADAGAKTLRDELGSSLSSLGGKVAKTMDDLGEKQSVALGTATKTIKELGDANERRQDALRTTVEGRLDKLRTENSEKLDQMRVTVDEKLQGTLNERLGASFSQVNENLERVHKSVGEMQTLATDVGGLKRVLSSVKNRGTWGEYTLGDLLDQVLTTEQYEKNVQVKTRSKERVDFAIKLPGDGNTPLWLPIDSKMPHESYERLLSASDQGDAEGVKRAQKELERAICANAQDICSKYVQPPATTDFAVMFLPSEGLFAEVARIPGLITKLQNEHRVSVVGPTSLYSLLNSLRLGFRTLVIQKQSSEVWKVLSGVKLEFGKFGGLLESVGKKIDEAQSALRKVEDGKQKVEKRLLSVEVIEDRTKEPDLLVDAVEQLLDNDDAQRVSSVE